ncbi:cytochrome P450 [Nonomuraea typhae]|uniref:Cytochrome P450 n=1 Tax=Nonomuraea typhae TaxID=2603600 RepID=A0ABW7YX87_9ACTN
MWRFTTGALELAGTPLPAGAPILIDIEGINTAPTRHSHPHVLDPHRPTLPDLTFGDGPHVCIGAQLARLEAHVLVELIRTDFPDACLAVPFDQLQRDRSAAHSCRLRSLPVWPLGAVYVTNALKAANTKIEIAESK